MDRILRDGVDEVKAEGFPPGSNHGGKEKFGEYGFTVDGTQNGCQEPTLNMPCLTLTVFHMNDGSGLFFRGPKTALNRFCEIFALQSPRFDETIHVQGGDNHD